MLGAQLWVVPSSWHSDDPNAEALLSPYERERAEGIRAAAVRDRYVSTRIALRILLGSVLGIGPAEVPIEIDDRGKPHLPPDASLFFNLSHSADRSVVGIVEGAPIGVDIEMRGRPFSWQSVARRF